MSTINVLIVVDALGATTSGNLGANVYMIDTNKHDGSGNEGQDELYTACKSSSQGGDTIVWAIAPVDPGSDVSIAGFTGTMISGKYLLPEEYPNGSWSGALVPNLGSENIQYSVTISIDGKQYSFDPFLKVNQ